MNEEIKNDVLLVYLRIRHPRFGDMLVAKFPRKKVELEKLAVYSGSGPKTDDHHLKYLGDYLTITEIHKGVDAYTIFVDWAGY